LLLGLGAGFSSSSISTSFSLGLASFSLGLASFLGSLLSFFGAIYFLKETLKNGLKKNLYK